MSPGYKNLPSFLLIALFFLAVVLFPPTWKTCSGDTSMLPGGLVIGLFGGVVE